MQTLAVLLPYAVTLASLAAVVAALADQVRAYRQRPPPPAPRVEPESEEEALRVIAAHAIAQRRVQDAPAPPAERPRRTTRRPERGG